MRKSLFSKWIWIVLAWWPMAPHAGGMPARQSFIVGVVPQYEARHIHSVWRPILDQLEQRTGMTFILRNVPSIPEFEQALERGEFDFAYMNPYHMLRAHDTQGYRPLLRETGHSLYGILVVPKKSPIKRVTDVCGQVVSLPAPNALGASLLLQADLADIFRCRIKPRYVLTHDSVYLNVLLDETIAGGGIQQTFAQQPQSVQQGLRVLYRTRAVTPHPFAVHPRVDEAAVDRTVAAFQALAETKAGAALLARIPVSHLGPASMEDYLPLRKMALENYVSSGEVH